ncbi:MAG TPA: hydroxyisourate hydrolase [Beijerinckiaceae bacterium]|nr:hydroxyisourate hydrolase [Beijerinckiaceae bacterium]
MARLSTHVLDTSIGRPAQGVKLRLARVTERGETEVATATTNSDGRTDQPLLSGQAYQPGTYVLYFDVREYFSARTPPAASPFLDVVPIRFSMVEPDGHYHVPLVVTPWSYSTYRGS